MKLIKTAEGKTKLRISKEEWERIGNENNWMKESKKDEEDWPESDELKKGRFTEYCKKQGFEGPCKACAEKAMKSDDSSVRGMASYYLNTVKPK